MSHPLRRRPLRVKLSLLLVVVLAIGLALSSMLATAALRGYLLDRVDEQLTRSVDRFTSFAGPIPDFAGTEPSGPRPPSPFYVEVRYTDGTTSVSTPDGLTSAVPVLPADAASAAGRPFTTGSVDGGEEWRVLVTPLGTGDGWALMAVPLADVQATVGRLVLLQLVVGLAVIVVAAALGYVVVRRSLRPLDHMAVVSHEIAEGDLSRRVSEEPSSAEIDQLASSFNTMVTRIEVSFAAQQASEAQARESEQRMRRFVADAGHELRTPLTSIRGYAELIEQGAAPDPGQAVARIHDEASRMGALVDDMQLLARLDEQRPLDVEPLRLSDVVEEAVSSARAGSPERAITVVHERDDVVVRGDRRRLRQVVDNLLSNAIRYSDPSTPITVVESGTTVTIADRGPGLTEDEAARVFDRLYRTDEARTRVRGGTGLGLAIVKSIVEAHGGEVFVTSTPGAGSTFGFTVPEVVGAEGSDVTSGS
jgi:two-component system, OmpR family, sensor kinase